MTKPDDNEQQMHVAPIGPELPSVLEARQRAMDERTAARARRAPEPRSIRDPGEGPTPERLAHAGDDVEVFTPADAEHYRSIRMVDTTPIDKLRKQMLITADQYNAGCKYYSDWFKAGFCPSGVIDPMKERVDGGTHKHMSDAVLAAMTRYNHALKALDYDASIAVQEVVLHEKSLKNYANMEAPEYSQFRERRSVALRLLRKGLTQLAQHYWPPRRTGVKVMVTEGSRPGIMPMEVGE